MCPSTSLALTTAAVLEHVPFCSLRVYNECVRVCMQLIAWPVQRKAGQKAVELEHISATCGTDSAACGRDSAACGTYSGSWKLATTDMYFNTRERHV